MLSQEVRNQLPPVVPDENWARAIAADLREQID
jgi:hypothetical protein